MPRLHDRLLAQGSKPLTGRDLMLMAQGSDGIRERSTMAEQLRTDRVADPTDEQITAAIERSRADQRAHRSTDSAPSGWPILAKAQVIIGDEVGHYLNTFPDGIQLSTLLITPVVPPFPHVFVDFRGVPTPYGFDEFGFLLSTLRHDDGWTIYGSLYGSWDGRSQIGPILAIKVPLDIDGNLVRTPVDDLNVSDDLRERLANGIPMIDRRMGGDLEFDAQLVGPFHDDLLNQTTNLLYMALLTISFTHVKNVNIVEIEPDPTQSRAYHRRHGRPLNTHYVLDIGGMRTVIDAETLRSGNVERAWHRCRGHFATYTSERPLFGLHTGTYWVPAHVRGNRAAGIIDKDYQQRVDGGEIGQAWHDDNPDSAPSAHEGGSNPDLASRGWRGHADTLNRLAAHLTVTGRMPRRAGPGDPQFDCAWESEDGWAVAEVKSITDSNEAEQIRRGIGQVLDYRRALADATGRTVTAVLVLEREPASRWLDVCADADISVVWPDAFDRLPT